MALLKKKDKTFEQILGELNEGGLSHIKPKKGGYKKTSLDALGYDLDGFVIIDDKGKVVEIATSENIDNVWNLYKAKALQNKQKVEDEQFVLERAKANRALKRSEKAKLETLKTDDEKHFERFNMAKQRYLDILAKIDAESQKKESDGGMGLPYSELNQQEVAELKQNNATVKGLFNKMEASERNLLKVSRALTQISGEDYRSKAYNLLESTLPGVTEVSKHKDLLKLQEKHYIDEETGKKSLTDERPWYKRMVSSKEPETSVDPEELYRVEKTGSYFKEGEDIVGGAVTGGPGWEKVDYDPYGKSKEQKDLSEDELLDILVREKKKKK
jgi:hypothetical protein